ncbi:MAG: hypothetical protein JNL70_21315 [Saprospiraceae bacterium]|nr:hypothetical protein [Saprospiraceae bacterium]
MLNVKQILLLVVAFAFVAIDAAFSQSNTKIDSLTAVLNKYPKEDTVKARLLIELSRASVKIKIKEGMAYSEQALTILENFNAPELKADALYTKARHLEAMGRNKEALDVILTTVDVYKSLQRAKKMIEVYNLLGLIYGNLLEAENQRNYYDRALNLSEQIKDITNKIIALNGLGNAYSDLGDRKKAIN